MDTCYDKAMVRRSCWPYHNVKVTGRVTECLMPFWQLRTAA